ncbi:AraC family transcriptional regulator [Alteriqipengyuania lutimaris]|uniref:AraC family transcriptional regulator n=2 Tax=Alteriqipengyuania lutimaris TaxID=1538146 RepID=A0A395LNE5_9SPHN|nr:AraC family transcriptional regulator [Alteriqipengyuania lutimaris]
MEEEFELWRWGITPLFDLDVRPGADPVEFALSSSAYHFADLSISRTTATPSLFDRNASVVARSANDLLMLIWVMEGGMQLRTSRGESEIGPGDICAIDLQRRCRIETVNYRHTTVLMPRSLFTGVTGNVDQLHGTIFRSGDPMTSLLRAHFDGMIGQAGRFSGMEGRAAALGTASLVASYCGLAEEGWAALGEVRHAALLHDMRAMVEAKLHDPAFGPDALCAAFGLSRPTVYRLFEPLGGVASFIRRRRLRHAFALLTDKRNAALSIGTIANRCGFSSDAVFSRAFRHAYEMSPRTLRAMGRETESHPQFREATAFRVMKDWLLNGDIAPVFGNAIRG